MTIGRESDRTLIKQFNERARAVEASRVEAEARELANAKAPLSRQVEAARADLPALRAVVDDALAYATSIDAIPWGDVRIPDSIIRDLRELRQLESIPDATQRWIDTYDTMTHDDLKVQFRREYILGGIQQFTRERADNISRYVTSLKSGIELTLSRVKIEPTRMLSPGVAAYADMEAANQPIRVVMNDDDE
jgi:hypothetical protein